MLLASMLAAQAVSPAPTDPAPPLVVDLLARPKCAPSAEGELVVCGRRDDRYRLPPLPSSEAGLPKAETSLLGGTGAIETEAVDVGGFQSNRLMARLKFRF